MALPSYRRFNILTACGWGLVAAFGVVQLLVAICKSNRSNQAQGAVTATLSDNNGYLRITFSNVQNPNGDLYITGTVRALT